MSIGQVELKLTNFNHFTHSWHSLRWWVKPSFNVCHWSLKITMGFYLLSLHILLENIHQ
jgi:hypothetical protein